MALAPERGLGAQAIPVVASNGQRAEIGHHDDVMEISATQFHRPNAPDTSVGAHHNATAQQIQRDWCV